MKRQSCHDIETSQLICSASQLTGFFIMASLAFNEFSKQELCYGAISQRYHVISEWRYKGTFEFTEIVNNDSLKRGRAYMSNCEIYIPLFSEFAHTIGNIFTIWFC